MAAARESDRKEIGVTLETKEYLVITEPKAPLDRKVGRRNRKTVD